MQTDPTQSASALNQAKKKKDTHPETFVFIIFFLLIREEPVQQVGLDLGHARNHQNLTTADGDSTGCKVSNAKAGPRKVAYLVALATQDLNRPSPAARRGARDMCLRACARY